jgi:23S rRNA (adenine-N6)-dimethyltransferase
MARLLGSPAWQTQNFLHKRALVDRLLNLAAIGPADLVLDLGAGRGLITERLAERCRRVIAVENDPGLAAGLRRRFASHSNVTIHEADLLRMRLPRQPYSVFANIPFDGTARLLGRLTSATYAPDASYLVVQREAAARIVGWPRETLFSLLRKPWFEAEVIHRFLRTDFIPQPRVDVVFLRLHKRGPPLVPEVQAAFYRDFLTACFRSSERSVLSTLQRLLGRQRSMRLARAADLPPTVGPAAVPLQVWLALFQAVARDDGLRRRLSMLPRSR